jgi:hypothetical protein
MAFDPIRGVGVLFGGSNGETDTWEWNGSAWALKTTIGPSARYGHAMAFDPVIGAIVLFGGMVDNVHNREMWQWNGSAWTQRTESSPPELARRFHSMAFDSVNHEMRVFGGSATNGLLDDFWSFGFGYRFPESAPRAENHPACGGTTYASKNRYLSIVPPVVPDGANGIALRVTLTTMPGPSDCPEIRDLSSFRGQQMWIGSEVLLGGVTPTGVHRLQSAPLFRDWTTVEGGLIQVSDCNIVPCATYTIESISDTDFPAGPYSAPLLLATSPVWGDVVGFGGATADGVVNALDVVGMVDRFRGVSGAPPGTWCDLHANSPTQGVKLPIDALDIVMVVDAFRGIDYPFSGPTAPLACP